jgi:hypothetical protein
MAAMDQHHAAVLWFVGRWGGVRSASSLPFIAHNAGLSSGFDATHACSVSTDEVLICTSERLDLLELGRVVNVPPKKIRPNFRTQKENSPKPEAT